VSDTLLDGQSVRTYLEAVEWLFDVVGHPLVVEAWTQPSALSRYSVGGVAAHAVQGGVLRVEQLLEEPEPSDRRRIGVSEFFGANRMDSPEADDPLFVVLRSMAEGMAEAGPMRLLDQGAHALTRLRTVLPNCRADRAVSLARVPDAQVPFAAYLQTRVLEVVVHGDDLVASLPGCEAPEPPPSAVDVCLDVCLGLARARLSGLGALRAFTRSERVSAASLRVL
jgi:hypothetical protein